MENYFKTLKKKRRKKWNDANHYFVSTCVITYSLHELVLLQFESNTLTKM